MSAVGAFQDFRKKQLIVSSVEIDLNESQQVFKEIVFLPWPHKAELN